MKKMKRLFVYAAGLLVLLVSACGLMPSKHEILTGLKFETVDSVPEAEKVSILVRLPERYDEKQLDTINSIYRGKSDTTLQLEIVYLLPGQVKDVKAYAKAFYPSDVKTKRVYKRKDVFGYPVSITLMGMDKAGAGKLLSFNPPELKGKTVLGKFIDDASKKCTVVYTDGNKNSGQAHIGDLFSDGKLKPVAVSPITKIDKGVKVAVDKDGDHYTIVDSVLSKFNAGNPSKPYLVIKSDI